MSSDSLIHALAGSVGGIVAMTATYPLIFLSTRAAVLANKEKKSALEVVRDILRREGFTRFYDGVYSSLLGIAVANGVYYYFYERSRAIVTKSRAGSKALSTPESMLIGLVAGSATAIISNPIWVVQTSQTVQPASSSPTISSSSSLSSSNTPASSGKMNIIQTVRYILRKGGISAFWRGVGPALVLVANPVLQYTVFEQLKNILIRRRSDRLRAAGQKGAIALLTDLDYFFLGAVSKLVSTSLTYPYLVVKNRMQAGSEKALKYKSSLDGLLTIYGEEGFEGLYRGIGSKLVQSVLTAAILFASQKRIYELTKSAIANVAST